MTPRSLSISSSSSNSPQLEGVAAHLPLLVDDAALLVYLLVFQQQSAAPVFQHQEAGVQGALAGGGHVTDAVHSLVDRSVGVQIAAKFHSESSGELDDSVAGEVLRTIECHVLQEVSQPALVLLLVDGAHALGDVEVRHVLRVVVVADVVGKPVVELAHPYLLVLGDGRHLLRDGLPRKQEHGQSQGH